MLLLCGTGRGRASPYLIIIFMLMLNLIVMTSVIFAKDLFPKMHRNATHARFTFIRQAFTFPKVEIFIYVSKHFQYRESVKMYFIRQPGF